MMKKIAAVMLALLMSASILTGCGKGDSTSGTDSSGTSQNDGSDTGDDTSAIDVDKLVIPDKKLVIDGEEVDTDGLVMMTINDKYEVSFDLYRYFYFFIINYYGFDISLVADEDKEAAMKDLIDTVEIYIENFYSYYALADELGIEFTDEDEALAKEYLQEAIDEVGTAEDAEKYFQSQYATTEVVLDLYREEVMYNKVSERLFGENGDYYISQEDFLEFAKTEEYAQVKHVLVTFASQAELSADDKEGFDELSLSQKLQLKEAAYDALSDDEKKVADEKAKIEIESVLKKVEAGDDFDQLIKDYGWDPGMEQSPEGYFITENTSFVTEFLEAAFALKEGETSGVVESDYGYHILKREPMDMDYVNENLDYLYASYYQNDVISGIGSKLLDETFEKMTSSRNEVMDKMTYDSLS